MNSTASNALVQFVMRHGALATFGCSRQHEQHGYQLQRRTIPDYNLIYVTRGKVVWVIGDEPVALEPGVLLIVPPGVAHHAHSTTKRITLLSLHVKLTLPGGRDAFELITLPRTQVVARPSRLDDYLLGALGEFDGDQPRRAMLMPGWAHLVMMELLADNAARGLIGSRSVDPIVADMLDELTRRMDKPTTLGQLAKLAGYTPQHLNRVFQRSLGVTPLQHLGHLRMEKAGEMLLRTGKTVAAIGREVGFDDPYHFSRVFKQHHGHSPSDHRQRADSNPPS